MKAIYDAVRALAYPKEAQQQAGIAFSSGSFRAPVREALRRFERANRGNRNRLDSLELSATARNSAAYYELEPQNWVVRERLGTTFTALADEVLKGHPHPSSQNLERLWAAKDNSGWMRTYVYHRLGTLLQTAQKLGLPSDFELISRFAFTDQGVSLNLRVCDSRGYLEAERDVQIKVVVQSFNDVVAFEREAKASLSALFQDILTWPEFKFRAMCR